MTWRDRVALSKLMLAFGTLSTHASRLIDQRTARPLTAMIVCPLAVIPLSLYGVWFLVGLCFVASWWWADRAWRWTWLVSVECGAFGSVWAYTFSDALSRFDGARIVTGTIWAGASLLMALVSLLNRRRNGHLDDYAGY
jgi:hypothetical protein